MEAWRCIRSEYRGNPFLYFKQSFLTWTGWLHCTSATFQQHGEQWHFLLDDSLNCLKKPQGHPEGITTRMPHSCTDFYFYENVLNHCWTDPSIVSILFTVASEPELAGCEAAALVFPFCDSSFAEGGRRMHVAARPSRMTLGLATNPTITPICCTICSRVVSWRKRKKRKQMF